MSCPIRAIVFDVYGTLISTGTGSVEAAREILARNRREAPSPQDFYRRWKALHRAHMDQLEDAGNFLREEDIFLADLDQLYREYGMGRSAKDDGKIMLKPWESARPFRNRERCWNIWPAGLSLPLGPQQTPPLCWRIWSAAA